MDNRHQIERRIKEAFEDVVERPESERPSAMDALDPIIRSEVESLLRHDVVAGPFLIPPYSETPQQPRLSDISGVHHIGPYVLSGELGRGGSAVVYLAKRCDKLFDRYVAIKIFRDPYATGEFEDRFRRELQVLAKLDHPTIVRMLDAGTTSDGRAFVVTEFVEGAVLGAKEHSMSTRQVAQFLLELCEGLSAAHRSGVVHRDIKPQNIIVTTQGHPKLVDFGIARLIESESEFTRTGENRMTVAYASPEQVAGVRPLGPSTDIFSLGVVLYELLSGSRPFQGGTHFELANSIREFEPPSPAYVSSDSSPELAAICLKMLQKNPLDRYSSMEELCDEFRAFLDGRPVGACREALWRWTVRIRRKYLPKAAIVAGLVGVFGAGTVLYQQQLQRSDEAFFKVATIAKTANADTKFASSEASNTRLVRARRDIEVLRMVVDRDPRNEEHRRELRNALVSMASILSHPASQSVGDTRGATEAYTEAVELATQLHKSNRQHVSDAIGFSTAKCSLGSLLIEQNRYKEARMQFEDAISANFETTNQTNEQRNRSAAYAEVIAHLSRVSLHEGNRTECLRLRFQALEIRRRVSASDPANRWFRYEVAGGLALYGWALREFGQFQAGLKAYQEGTAIASEITREANGLDRAALSLLAKNHYETGRIYLALNKHSEGHRSLSNSVATFRKLQAIEPESVSNIRSMGLALSALAGLESNRERAMRAIEEALQYAERAAREDLTNAKAREELASVQRRKARIEESRSEDRIDLMGFVQEVVQGR